MAGLSLYQEIFKQKKLDYALCNSNRRVVEYSPGLLRYAQHISGPLRGQPIENLFDLLTGMEADLDGVIRKEIPTIAIEKIHHRLNANESLYFSVHISPYQNGALMLISDVTEEALLEQRITQQRNQLDIISAQLAQSRAELDDLLHRLMPARAADRAISARGRITVGGQRGQISALFADMRGFTPMVEALPPEEILNLLNQHFALMGEAITHNGGEITNYVGDMVMAVFNAHGDQPDHAARAVQTGLDLQQILPEQFQQAHSSLPFLLDFGVGISSGEAVIGYLGFDNRLDYTAIGEQINTASRLSGYAKGGQVLLTAQTQSLIKSTLDLTELGPVTLRGISRPVLVYEVHPSISK
ncbi:MAG: hypothetical protein CO094_00360 [Anaerolineae bacterium CG_4_9_14_3_um_filter_57_17]|nr:hypothetical protein [bacterium]NCT20779.1 hypothetical protein [bacterium]OIO84130.1 MAG: hypothetical protein AUK01_10200 [Anaerolineae bacterium CG2_30_57_67]PJB68636.1 MAG: hypothetical protein CO094_00360 [Anaerolineae bacterium CG_4_9_14_3_um_filter_57_17]